MRFQTVPCVRPGGEVLLHQSSWPRVHRMLEAIDAVEAQDIDLTEVSPDCCCDLDTSQNPLFMGLIV